MSKMWPCNLPPEILRNPLRSTECKVFNELQRQLSAEYTAFYSRPWHGLSRHGDEIDGECDFIVAHPQHGVLFIEVKGGRVEYDPAMHVWTSIDRYDITHEIKNPVDQARTSKYHMLKKLIKSEKWPHHKVHLSHGVIFPDCEVPDGDLGPDMPREIFCDRNQFMKNLKLWIRQRLRTEECSTSKALGVNGVVALENILAKPIHLHRPLAYDIEDNDKSIFTLTQNQFGILKIINNITRAAISGGAGTGKTVLATEEAIRCSKSGLSTLFICFNSPLALKVQHEMLEFPEIPIQTFHSLCGHMARESGQTIREANQSKLYDEILPEALIQAAELLPHIRYEAIIVDEGQDFKEHWWVALLSFLKDEKSKLRIFWDCNQAVYGSPTLPENTETIDIPLDKNLRNSKQIFKMTNKFYKGPTIFAAGPDGPPVKFKEVGNSESHAGATADIIRELIHSGKVNNASITILVDKDTKKIVEDLSRLISKAQFESHNSKNTSNITVETVKRFKGLESQVVIVICSDELVHDTKIKYIAFSRAITSLIVVGTKNQLSTLDSK